MLIGAIDIYLVFYFVFKSVLTLSVWAFFFEFQQNSNIATTIAIARPQSSTTKTPPMFLTPKEFALESLLLSSLRHVIPVNFHHRLYNS